MPNIITAEELRDVLGVGANVLDATLDQVIDAAEGIITPYLKVSNGGIEIDYSLIAPVKEAVLDASIDIFRMRSAPGGNYSAVDFTPNPWALGRQFFERYEGLLAPWINVKGLIG